MHRIIRHSSLLPYGRAAAASSLRFAGWGSPGGSSGGWDASGGGWGAQAQGGSDGWGADAGWGAAPASAAAPATRKQGATWGAPADEGWGAAGGGRGRGNRGGGRGRGRPPRGGGGWGAAQSTTGTWGSPQTSGGWGASPGAGSWGQGSTQWGAPPEGGAAAAGGDWSTTTPSFTETAPRVDPMTLTAVAVEIDGIKKLVGQRVLISGISDDTTWQSLKDHMRQAAECIHCKIFRGGRGLVVFATPEEAAKAIAELQGSELEGGTIFLREDREDVVVINTKRRIREAREALQREKKDKEQAQLAAEQPPLPPVEPAAAANQ